MAASNSFAWSQEGFTFGQAELTRAITDELAKHGYTGDSDEVAAQVAIFLEKRVQSHRISMSFQQWAIAFDSKTRILRGYISALMQEDPKLSAEELLQKIEDKLRRKFI